MKRRSEATDNAAEVDNTSGKVKYCLGKFF